MRTASPLTWCHGGRMGWNVRVSEGNRGIDRWLLVLFFVVFVIGLVVGVYQWWAMGWRF
jgi:hypothetical protein